MSSPPAPPRRRRRSDIESDDDADIIRSSLRQTQSSLHLDSSKRARTNGYRSDIQSESPEPESSRSHHRPRKIQDEDEGEDEDEESDDDSGKTNDYQPGSIVRVKMTNFVTYEKAEFFPGPNLNMVIGPNGTGKSSLVCAICLGLGYSPKNLGRATEIGEFVKHNTNEAEVEIELFRRKEDDHNRVIRSSMNRQNNVKFWIDGKVTTQKAVRALVDTFRIQVDNLCQFLPQDRVHEFSSLNAVELLRETQRAAAPPEMLRWHMDLKKLRMMQKEREVEVTKTQEILRNLGSRQQNLHAEVQKLHERRAIQERIELLRQTKPFVEYNIAIARHKDFKKKKDAAQQLFRELEERIEPTIRSIKAKERYAAQITTVLAERKAALKKVEEETGNITANIQSLEEEITGHENSSEAQKKSAQNLRKDIHDIQRKITSLKARSNDAPLEFNAPQFNERIREKSNQLKEAEAELVAFNERKAEVSRLGRTNRNDLEAANQNLAEFDSQEGQLMSKLRQKSRQVADAWDWVQKNPGEFKQEVYGPALVTCSIKDPRYTPAVESLLRENLLMSFTVQNSEDMKTLSNIMHQEKGYTDVGIRTAGSPPGRGVSDEDLRRYGMDGLAIDFVDGPGPVLAMLANNGRMAGCAVTLNDINDETYNTIIAEKKLNHWATATRSFGVSRREEYGPSAFSTTTRAIDAPKFWTDQPVDTSARSEIQARISSLEESFNELKRVRNEINEGRTDVEKRAKELTVEIASIKEEKATLQREYNQQAALPDRISAEEEKLSDKKKQLFEFREELKKLNIKIDHAVTRKAKRSLQYKVQVSKIRISLEGILEAAVRLIEAQSDVEGLKDRNVDIMRQRDEERARTQEAEDESKRAKDIAKRALAACNAIIAEVDEDTGKKLTTSPEGTTVESLDNEIQAEQSSLDCIHAGDPRAIEKFESQEKEIAKRREELEKFEEELTDIASRISRKRAKWEKQLDDLVVKISEAFSYNLERIGCAGEVGVHKDEEFEKWELHIKVKFRENETLQLLDARRQSGGERSVSTIFFLMALQALAQAPFRVVDEINQGMDPRNERMVHERMVEIACKEHTSQYFLITPKLLTNLRYDRRMKVMCIASGQHMPDDYKKLDISRIIGIQRAIVASAG